LDQLQADMIIDCIEDALKPLLGYLWDDDETRKVLTLYFWGGWVLEAEKYSS